MDRGWSGERPTKPAGAHGYARAWRSHPLRRDTKPDGRGARKRTQGTTRGSTRSAVRAFRDRGVLALEGIDRLNRSTDEVQSSRFRSIHILVGKVINGLDRITGGCWLAEAPLALSHRPWVDSISLGFFYLTSKGPYLSTWSALKWKRQRRHTCANVQTKTRKGTIISGCPRPPRPRPRPPPCWGWGLGSGRGRAR